MILFKLQGSSVDEEEDQEIDPEGQSPEGQNHHQGQKEGQNLDDSGQASGTGKVWKRILYQKFVNFCYTLSKVMMNKGKKHLHFRKKSQPNFQYLTHQTSSGLILF